MRRIALLATVIAAAAAALAATAGADDAHTYKIEMYNAFGIVEGSDVRVSGVNSGTVKDLEINEDKRAVVTVELKGPLGVLGEKTTCSTEPQSLIAEYFIDCQPAGPELPENETIPASRVSQTVQNDLVLSTMREPFKQRFRLLINEFGTALAGNPDNLNEAIRLGAPALTQFRKATKILAEQNAIIRDLNVNSDEVIGRLTERREDVVRFVQEARDTAAASAERRDDLSRDFELLDDFLAELEPTLAELENVAVESTPLLTDLRAAAPGLAELSRNLPPFNAAATRSLDTLGDAGVVGRRALRRGRDEIKQLAESGKKAPQVTEMLADFLRDLDDPRRSVEIDDRAPEDTGRTNPEAGQRNTKGYTGFESILNYAYYQTLAINQYDRVGHLLHINLSEVFTGPCGAFSTGRDHDTGEPGVPATGGGTTTRLLGSNPSAPDPQDAARCIAWLGPNQPGINDPVVMDGDLPQYHPSVCPNGTAPEAAEQELCDSDPSTTSAPASARGGDAKRNRRSSSESSSEGNAALDAADILDNGPVPTVPDDVVEGILRTLEGARHGLRPKRNGKRGKRNSGRSAPAATGAPLREVPKGTDRAVRDLLDFLFSN